MFYTKSNFLNQLKLGHFQIHLTLIVLTQTVFCFGKYRKYLSQNSCGGHVFNKFERGLPLVLSNVYPISWMHLFLFCNTAEQVSFLHAYFLWLRANLKVQANLIKFVKSSDLYQFFLSKELLLMLLLVRYLAIKLYL